MPWRLLIARGLCGVIAVLVSGSVGCSGDTTDPVSLTPAQTYWALRFNWHSVNLAVTPSATQPGADTVHLQATALNALGTPFAGAGSVRYRNTDSAVTVDSLTGLVTAKHLTSGTPTSVIASLTEDGVTHADTARIQVTQTPLPAPLATFSIQPNPTDPNALDSAKVAIDGSILGVFPVVSVYATMATGSATTDTVCNLRGCSPTLLISFVGSDPTIATIDSTGRVTANIPGKVTFMATTYAYGVAKRDSLPFVIGWSVQSAQIHVVQLQSSGSANPILSFAPSSITVGVGGLVAFITNNSIPIDVVFDSTQVRQNSISIFGGVSNQPNAYTVYPLVNDTLGDHDMYVQVAAVGTYTYHSRLFGTMGTIIASNGP